MSRADKWDVEITSIKPINKGFIIRWSGNIGFGEYAVYETGGRLVGESECMDRGDDKAFLRYLLSKVADNIEIIE